MLKYLIIQLDDTSTSYCHYGNSVQEKRLISPDNLKAGIIYAMKENLMVHFVYPDYTLPQEYKDIIDSIDHCDIISSLCEDDELRKNADIVIFHEWTGLNYFQFNDKHVYVLRTSKADFFDRYHFLYELLAKSKRLNIVITDVETFTDEEFELYKQTLKNISSELKQLYVSGKSPQLNLLTDRMMLTEMNNCNAGWENITLAPDGRFYICPAFYHEHAYYIGSIKEGINIKNPQLYRLDHAPICRHCDAYQCRRCIWLNRKTTLEVNTPSHEQCVMAHIERNSSRELLLEIRRHGTFLPKQEGLKEIDYLDPFEKREEWQA